MFIEAASSITPAPSAESHAPTLVLPLLTAMAGGSVPRQYAALLDDDGFEDPVFATIPWKLLKAKAFSVRCHKTVYNADNLSLEILLRCFANGNVWSPDDRLSVTKHVPPGHGKWVNTFDALTGKVAVPGFDLVLTGTDGYFLEELSVR